MPDKAYANAPAIVFIHGGGWIKGRQSGMDKVYQAAARHGLVDMTIQYRLSPANSWPSQLEDAQLAVRWLRAQAKDCEVDPTRICSWEESAGRHLAVFLGVMQTTRPGDRANLYSVKEMSNAAARATNRRVGDPPMLVADARAFAGFLGKWTDIERIVASAWAWHDRPNH